MLSILIPVYNYDCFALVQELHKQSVEKGITFEIVVHDDGSQSHLEKNEKINKLNNCFYHKLSCNIGRSAIRNLLVDKAKYDTLLFLDADTYPCEPNFISNYVKFISSSKLVISGGLKYDPTYVPKDYEKLRYLFGNVRESVKLADRKHSPYRTFLSSNFMIKKNVFQEIRFNDKIPDLACEDTVFAMDLKKNKIKILHVENPVYHLGLETNEIFLEKSLNSINSRKRMVKNGVLNPENTKITALAKKITTYKLAGIISALFPLVEKFLKKNILSKNPSLVYYDLYRLGYYFKKETK